jgi:hypothetical protein
MARNGVWPVPRVFFQFNRNRSFPAIVRDGGYSAMDLKHRGLQQFLGEVPTKTPRFAGIVGFSRSSPSSEG